jgi:monofunctional biosynthetic peptidoglycan transglycosylase
LRLKKDWVSFEEISPNMVKAAMAAEDNRFRNHNGFDFEEIKRAREDAKRSGKRPRGASTISQQTAKNVFLWHGRNYLRKGMEVYQTVLIEAIWSKERIMEVYLNVVELGDGIYGVEAASQHYFGKSANKLTKRQAALLASALPNPLKRNPASPDRRLNRKANRVMFLMNKVGSANFED